jgi:tetraacyldisaccharide 4'-kinase
MAGLAALYRRMAVGEGAGAGLRLLSLLLAPLGWLYGLLGRLRAALYSIGLRPVYRAPVPVVSVGNLAVGGTGKTPMVDCLIGLLLRRGKRVAVVSRGYGGRGLEGVAVVSTGDGSPPRLAPEICGDEPYLLCRRNPQIVMLVARRRAKGVQEAVERHGAEVVILDDGFQHLAVARDLDLVLLDARRPLGNGRVLPAGLLREFPGALRRARMLVLTRSGGAEDPSLPAVAPRLRCRHRLGGEAVSLAGDVVSLTELAGRRCVAFAGIADPSGFFRSLAEAGIVPVATLALSDHAVYDSSTLARLAEMAVGADFLVTTEKDGVKLRPEQLPRPCYQVAVALEFYDEGSLQVERALDALFTAER